MKESYVTKNISIQLHIPLLCSMQFFKTILFCKCNSPEKLLFINDQNCIFHLVAVFRYIQNSVTPARLRDSTNRCARLGDYI